MLISGPRGVDFFCSARGLPLDSRAADCRIVAAVDSDTTAGETFSGDLGEFPAVLSGDRGDLKLLIIRTRSDLSYSTPSSVDRPIKRIRGSDAPTL